MKRIIIFLGIMVYLCSDMNAQEINWRSPRTMSRHTIGLHLGLDYGTSYGLSYGYHVPVNFPLVVGMEVTLPFGETVFDDWKAKLTAQTEVWHTDRFSWTVKPALNIKSYGSDVAQFYSIGAELGTSLGYYRPHWGMAAVANYDKAGGSYIRHRRLKEYYPEIQDGWFRATGGSFKFGLAGTYVFRTVDVHLGAGKVYGQNFSDNPTLPFYVNLSLQKYLR